MGSRAPPTPPPPVAEQLELRPVCRGPTHHLKIGVTGVFSEQFLHVSCLSCCYPPFLMPSLSLKQNITNPQNPTPQVVIYSSGALT